MVKVINSWNKKWLLKNENQQLNLRRFAFRSVYGRKTLPILKFIKIIQSLTLYGPVTVAARSKAWNVFARLNTGIVGSNPARGMDVCVYSVFVLSCVSSGLATGWSPAQGVLPTVYKCKIKKPRKRRTRPDMGCKRHWIIIIIIIIIMLYGMHYLQNQQQYAYLHFSWPYRNIL
jgi:hypothetical protein